MPSVLLVLLLSLAPGRAGGWTQPAGQHYAKVWQRTLLGQRGFLASGSSIDLGEDARFTDVTLNAYGEVGVTDTWTLILSTTPVGYAAVGANSTVYAGTTVVGVRRALRTDALKVAAEARLGGTPPLGTARLGSDMARGWVWESNVPTVQADGELQVGYGLPHGAWVTAAAGMRWTSAAALPASALGLLAVGQSGQRISRSVMLSTVQPLSPVTVSNVAGTGATRYIGVEPTLGVRLGPRTALVASVGGVLMAQANAATPALNLGVEHR